ncbi:5-methyltetrahydropteroyltriglutamate--homocysteine S-methyltransferase [Companilactobacillus sp.]|jgi:methionine synthase II (cobalamin-independent)|uniref:5-methyltetrahydropteroyltriglutamate-- homocysteine S-methyltransferase n=1 Tax=Companilactobacillus sp. TaxID=2767905 RepID=UPI0025BBA05F|nr:5-methyltetrahydropteroyltriglutamate--homocysteine S-methyltransferase [Companilactobacillus sp.]MCH4009110.1 5-methyltetrahydropteroyltriglutamate--homocysteine S-methyltransferase [Companilactobacillus sp.]MCH4050711.1 5-methyltetrahydropteroyltriglutamate--homocysteine S-methyltransferase [Companilactobacillus sp.]MCH4077052.1 5-methyltetrahydropteroyltriglutamate--homocysteine S-methyltransferase [Companilactobacillus sp.]MCH4125628.1 5-methyltetrahydropteroyltriglutamate--homocysteine 
MTLTKQKIGFQHVGSFLRPNGLQQARKAHDKGFFSDSDLREIEDEAIKDLIIKEKEAGLEYVTDGEFRRSYWHLDFFWGFEGVEHIHYGEGYHFAHEETRDDTARLSGKISFNPITHPFIHDFDFVKSVTDDIGGVLPKQTIPAPAQLYIELIRGENNEKVKEFYPNQEDLIADIQKAYHDAIIAFYDEGARVIQLDDCSWGLFLDENFLATPDGKAYADSGIQDVLLELNNGAIKDLPDDLTINTHICRGNYHSDFAFSGSYAPVADTVFAKENVDTYFLEYDSSRAGGFEPLAKVSGEKNVVLGLLTTKSGQLENRQDIIDRINEASQYIPLDRLWLSTQCGFASTEEGNVLTEEQQWEKLKLVKSIIDEVWA